MSRKLVDIGIEWIGEIPENWRLILCKYLVSITTGRKDANEADEDGEFPFFTCSMEDKKISVYSFDTEALLVAGNGMVGYTRYYKGKFDAYQRTYVLSEFKNDINPLFLKYYFNGLLSSKLKIEKIGSVIDFIKLKDLQNFIILLPTIDEQLNIVNYLDKRCTKIDDIIEGNKKEIELLDEYRMNIISKVVFNGLGNTEYNKLNLSWLNKMPNNWNLINMRRLFEFRKGLSITKDNLVNDGISVISYGQIHSKLNDGTKILNSFIRYVADSFLETDDKCLVEKNDFIFADTSEDLEGCGNSVFIDRNENIFAGYHTIIVHPIKETSKYYAYLFSTDKWRSQIRSLVNGVKLYSITQKILKSCKVISPPLEEQIEIVKYLDNMCCKLDEVIEYRKQIIEKLEEYKKSLIYEVVTGKKEVQYGN